MRRRSVRRLTLALFGFAVVAHAQQPLLHEYIEPNAAEDVELSATTQDGAMPAALETESGIVSAPRAKPRRGRGEHAYGGNATPDSIDASFRVDRDTTRPDSVAYDEPFTPALAPFKRSYAYDSVDESFELVVHDKSLARLDIGGKASAADDQFYADLYVDLAPGIPVRIPSVGPGARPLVARTEPSASFQLQRDRADNWFMLADTRQRVRLTMQLAIERAAFEPQLADCSWSMLVRHLPPLPPEVRSAATDVAHQVGVSQSLSPRAATAALVGYFRGFSPSPAAPKAQRGAQLYQELALSRKGVCRHRAYAFVVTALGLGLPARMVRNEAHAWVEVSDGTRFHRIDLGGAAGRMDLDPGAADHLHRPPPDPFAWPEDSESGQAMLQSTLAGGENAAAPGTFTPAGTAAPKPAAPAASTAAALDSASPELGPAGDERPAALVSLTLGQPSAERGSSVEVSGSVVARGEACAFSRVDISLRDAAGIETWLGAFPTDENGRVDGRVTLPFEIDVGDYTVVARTPGAGRCGASP